MKSRRVSSPDLRVALITISLIVFISLAGCHSKSSDGTPSGPAQPATLVTYPVTVTWNANREAAVNKAGGGYTVYYHTTSGEELNGTAVSVPFVSGATAPTAAVLNLAAGTYYVKVVGFSAIASGSSASSQSVPSTEVSITVP